jgi:hypothetical protein
MPHAGKSESLYAATSPALNGEDEAHTEEALMQLLIHARRSLATHARLSLDFPAGEMTDAIMDAGFKPRRTLIWMRA